MYVKEIENQLIILNGNINEKINKTMALIGISGKISSGKDTVGKIIQYLTYDKQMLGSRNYFYPTDVFLEELKNNPRLFENEAAPFQIKKFADKLKDIVCILLSCTREQLEDREFKEKELGEEWDCWVNNSSKINNPPQLTLDKPSDFFNDLGGVSHRKLTPRLLLQLLGTECGRQIIHPNIWVNALMSDYNYKAKKEGFQRSVKDKDGIPISFEYEVEYPNWCITDMRFPNELEAVKSRGGITIRVERFTFIKNDLVYFKNDASDSPINGIYRVLEVKKDNCTLIDDKTGYSFGAWFEEISKTHEHESETALDNAEFDYTIENNSSIEDLIHTVSLILKREKII